MLSLIGCSDDTMLDPDDPVALTMWHVYGIQTQSPLNDSINEFNRTVGREKGIVINVVSVNNSSAIDKALTAAAENTPGVPALPDLFTAYPRIAEIIGYDRLLSWSDYFTEQELDAFVEAFLEEGYFEEQLLMLPIAKSTELLFVNQTLFEEFGAETGIHINDISTFDTTGGVFDACRKYYDWSNGQDLFKIDDFYTYALSGMTAYGEDFVLDGKLNLASDVFEKVWNPMAQAGIYGGLCLDDGYASERWKTGEIICNTGSTAGILYLRDYVTYEDNTTQDIEIATLAYPTFSDSTPAVVHRGGRAVRFKERG